MAYTVTIVIDLDVETRNDAWSKMEGIVDYLEDGLEEGENISASWVEYEKDGVEGDE